MLQVNAKGVGQAIFAKGLTLGGSGTVKAVSKYFSGIFLTGGLTVGAGCALEAAGDSDGISFQGSQTISGAGSIQAVGTTRAGIAFHTGTPTLTVAFDGDLAAEGGIYGIAHSGGPGTGTVDFTKTPDSLSIRGGTAAFGTFLSENPIFLANTANIPGLSEVFASGAKEFPAPPAVTVTTAGELKTELEKTTAQAINVTADIALTDMNQIAVGASHTVDLADGKAFTINGNTNINVGAHTLTIGGAGRESSTLVCNRDSGFALWGSAGGTLKLENITANVIRGNGIGTASTEIGRGARLVLAVPDEDNLVTVSDSLTVFGELNIKSFARTAISLRNSDMTIKNGGAVRVGKGNGSNQGIEVRQGSSIIVEGGGSLTGGAGNGGIFLNGASTVTGVANTFIDRGQTLSQNGIVRVGVATEPASPSGLTLGTYVWNGSAFEKCNIAGMEVSAGGQSGGFSVAKGGTLQFSATLKDGAGNEVGAALRGVEWTLESSSAPGTTISDSGLLTVAADETAADVHLEVRSVKNPQVALPFISVAIEGSVASGGGGGGSSTAKVDKSSVNVDNTGDVKPADVTKRAEKAIEDALKAGKSPRANVIVRNARSVSPKTLKEMAAAALTAGGTAQLIADTVVDGKIVARVYIEAEQAANLSGDIQLGVSVDSKATKVTQDLFGKFFDNPDLKVISMAYQGPIGMRVGIAVKIDLESFDPKNAYFYSYDKKTNTYLSIPAADFWVDSAGYLHFFTDHGGDILFTAKPLKAKQ